MIEFNYNTQQEPIAILEYGRNVQNMVNFTCKLPTKDERNLAAKTIIEIMGNLNPHLRDTPDYRHKLWDHLFIMSNFQLDVDSPYPIPDRKILESKPSRINYPFKRIKYKHYGYNLEVLIQKCANTEDPEQRKEFMQVLAHQMKKFYLSWNRDSVADETIAKQMIELSNGKLILNDDFKFIHTHEILKSGSLNPDNKPNNNNNLNRKKKKKKFKPRHNNF